MKPIALPPLPDHSPEPGFTPPTHPQDRAIRRAIVDHLEFGHTCPRAVCRRAGRCRDRNTACFDTRRAEIVAGMAAVLYDGYLADDEDAVF